MSASQPRNPKYRQYKPKDLGVVRLDGRDVYLGKFNSPESLEKYHRLVADWHACKPLFEATKPATDEAVTDSISPSVNDLILAYVQFALSYYRRNGEPSSEVEGIRYSLRPLRQLYGLSAAEAFGPKCLKAIRQHMISVQDLSRNEINKRIGRIVRLFRWAASEELVPVAVYEAVTARRISLIWIGLQAFARMRGRVPCFTLLGYATSATDLRCITTSGLTNSALIFVAARLLIQSRLSILFR
jgi:hypothetical protein